MAYIGRSVDIGMFEKQVLTPDSSTTTFTLTFAVGSANSLLVVYGGVIQEPQVAYSVSGGGQSIVFSEAPLVNHSLYVIYLGKQLTTPRAAGQETTKQTFTGDGTTTLFTLTDPPVVPAGIMVFVDGILQREGSGNNYVSGGSTINFTGAPDSGAEIDVYTLVKEKVSIDTVADGSITRAKLAASHPYWDASGKVGINTPTPTRLLHITGAGASGVSVSNPSIRLDNTATGRFGLFELSSDANMYIWNADAGTGSTVFMRGSGSGTESARIDTNGKLGINTTNPKALLHVASSNASDAPTLGTATGGVFITNANVNYGLHIGSQSTGNSWLQVTRNDSTATAYNLHLQPVGGVVAIGTSTADSLYNLTIQRFAGSSGNIMLQGDNVTIGLPNIVFKNTNGGATAYLGFNGDAITAKAIAFPATQVASSDANTLDDYEEGTWTPGVSFGGASVGITYTVQSGGYTKIGSQVTVWAQIAMSAKGSSTGTARITGLPFTNVNSPGRSEGATAAFNFWVNMTGTPVMLGYVQNNANTIYLMLGNAANSTGGMGDGYFTNSSAFYFNATYSVV
jgi:3D (Asp-Asp-Asp) domain-containing protein